LGGTQRFLGPTRGPARPALRALFRKKQSSHLTERVSHQNRSPRRDFRALDLLPERALRAGSKSHATPIGARTTAIHLVNALGGKKVRSRRARDIKLPLAPLSSSHLMPPVPMLPSQVKHFGLLFRGVRVDIAQGHRGDTHGHREALLSRTPVLFCSSDALRAHGQTLICTLRRLQDRRRPWRRSWAAGHASLMPPTR
jgi:hypothetical protein